MLLIAVVYDMITDRNIHFDTNDILSMVMVGLISLFSFIALQTIKQVVYQQLYQPCRQKIIHGGYSTH
jgi:hypothetical protein